VTHLRRQFVQQPPLLGSRPDHEGEFAEYRRGTWTGHWRSPGVELPGRPMEPKSASL